MVSHSGAFFYKYNNEEEGIILSVTISKTLGLILIEDEGITIIMG